MKILEIYPTYSCPFKCSFCFNKNKCNDTTLLDINNVDNFLSKNSKLFDKIIISGGEPSTLTTTYLSELVQTIKKYTDIEINSYNVMNINLIDGVTYNFSYDFLARPRVRESWIKLLELDKPFNITVTLSPIVFKYYPNKILQTLNLLKNLKKVTFKPYFKNEFTCFNIKSYDYKKFIMCVKESRLNLNYKVEFDDRFFGKEVDEFILTPYNKFNVVQYENELRIQKEIDIKDIKKYKTNYPTNVII